MSRIVDANIAGWVKEIGERVLSIRRLDIDRRLTLCFVLIIFAMLIGNAVLLWQFGKAEVSARRLGSVDQELIAVQQAHISLMSSYERLGELAQAQDSSRLLREVEDLRDAHLETRRRSRVALTHLPPEVHTDPTLLPTLVAIQDELPPQLDAIIVLAKANQWDAVRLRLTNQVRPLATRSATLVDNIDRTVSEERAQAVLNIQQVQRRVLFIVPITAGITFLFAALLGLAITHSITQPLGKLIEGSSALARGDFSHRVPASGRDAIARLGEVFNQMIVRLQQLYGEAQRRESYLSQAQLVEPYGKFRVECIRWRDLLVSGDLLHF